jgi:HSP20 family protein
MSLIRYTHPTIALQQQINRMFDQFDTSLFGHLENLGEGMFAPAVDIKEDAEAYTVQFEVPGIPQDNLDVSLQDNVLTIRGIKEQKQESNEGRYRRIECNYGTFARSLALPRNVDGDSVSAHLEDGVLEVRLPKRADALPRQIGVGITQSIGQAVDQAVNVDDGSPVQADADAQTVAVAAPHESEGDENASTGHDAAGASGAETADAKASGKRSTGSGARTSRKSGAKAAGSNGEEGPAGNPS